MNVSYLSTSRSFERGRHPRIHSMTKRRAGSPAHWAALLLALIAVTGCVSTGGIVQPPISIKQHKGNRHDTDPRSAHLGRQPTSDARYTGNQRDTEPSPRLVWLSNPSGSYYPALAQPGEYLLLGEFPYRYQGEQKLTWETRDHVVFVNGREAGLDLNDLDVKTAIALVTKHPAIENIRYWGKDVMPKPLMDALATMPGRRLALSLSNYRSASEDFAYLGSKLGGKLVSLFLEEYFVDNYTTIHLSRLPQLRTLHLSHSQVTGAGLTDLSHLPQLRSLGLCCTPVNDPGMEEVSRMKRLRELDLSDTRVRDTGMADLSRLTRLLFLNLEGTRVSDAGLAHLSAMTQLRSLDLSRTHVTDAGVKRFKESHPSCKVVR